MKKAVIIQYPSISHFNAAFEISRTLKDNGYVIYYLVEEKMRSYVEIHDFRCYTLFTKPVSENYEISGIYRYFDTLLNGATGFLIDIRKEELTEAISRINPDVVIVDTYAGSDFVLLYSLLKTKGIRFFYLETMLSSTKSRGVPYVDEDSFPDQKIKILYKQMKRETARHFTRIVKRIFYLGYDHYSNVLREIRFQNIPARYHLDSHNYLHLTCSNIISLITSPIELEFFATPQNVLKKYLGFFVKEHNPSLAEMSGQLATLISSNKKVIYVSFGTVFVSKKANVIGQFISKLQTAISELEDVVVVLSTGGSDHDSRYKNLDNIFVVKFVPQLCLLKYCVAFITHGGLNSIKEGIQECIPMLIYPLAVDQVGNAHKVSFKKIGLTGNIQEDSAAVIRSKISELIYNPTYKENIQTFKDRVTMNSNLRSTILSIVEKDGVVT